jgi:hypothetical protein
MTTRPKEHCITNPSRPDRHAVGGCSQYETLLPVRFVADDERLTGILMVCGMHLVRKSPGAAHRSG